MSPCTYCGDPARYTLDAELVCYDCQQRLSYAPKEERQATLIQALQNIHGMVLKGPHSLHHETWASDLARRIDFARAQVRDPVPSLVDTVCEMVLNGETPKESILEDLARMREIIKVEPAPSALRSTGDPVLDTLDKALEVVHTPAPVPLKFKGQKIKKFR